MTAVNNSFPHSSAHLLVQTPHGDPTKIQRLAQPPCSPGLPGEYTLSLVLPEKLSPCGEASDTNSSSHKFCGSALGTSVGVWLWLRVSHAVAIRSHLGVLEEAPSRVMHSQGCRPEASVPGLVNLPTGLPTHLHKRPNVPRSQGSQREQGEGHRASMQPWCS